MSIIQWCNENTGFLTAVLSVIGLILSFVAITVSINTARLPFKKRILLGSSINIGTSLGAGGSVNTSILGMSATATNIGNRRVSLMYLGFAVQKDGKLNMIYPLNRQFNGKGTLAPSEMLETQFSKDELIGGLSREKQDLKIFVYAKDTEGKEYKRRVGTIGKMIENLS